MIMLLHCMYHLYELDETRILNGELWSSGVGQRKLEKSSFILTFISIELSLNLLPYDITFELITNDTFESNKVQLWKWN